MLSEILTDSFFNFIESNRNADTNSLRLKLHGHSLPFSMDFALLQIDCRAKTRQKLAHFIKEPKFIFPTSVAAEQSSHQAVGCYHARLISPSSKVLDMTAGLGIDALSIAAAGSKVTACEIDSLKCEALRHNAEILGLNNISVCEGDSIQLLKGSSESYDVIFIDPARRGTENRRVYNLHDCTPDIISLKDEIMQYCSCLLIKASPLLDITQTLRDFPDVSAIHSVCVEGECKEILIELKSQASEVSYHAVDLDREGNIISSLHYSDIDFTDGEIAYALPNLTFHYLYEPNAAIMKLAPWRVLQKNFPELKKLDSDSHIFVSDTFYPSFPGRVMEVEKVITNKDRKTLKGLPVNIVSRNYPSSANDLRKKLGAKEGTDQFLYATRLATRPIMYLCRRIK